MDRLTVEKARTLKRGDQIVVAVNDGPSPRKMVIDEVIIKSDGTVELEMHDPAQELPWLY